MNFVWTNERSEKNKKQWYFKNKKVKKKERKKTKWMKGNYFLNQLKDLVKQNPIG